jgi:pilus assembly protein CpaB
MARLQEITATRGNRLLLALAVGAGAVAAVLVFVALSQETDGGGTVSGGPSTSVVVAAQDINAGTTISSDMVKNVETPDDQLISGAFTDTAVVVGEAARVKIYEGEQLAAGKVGADNDIEGLSGVLPPGMRGIAVGVEEVRAVGGLLRPGNRVDVYAAHVIEGEAGTDEDDIVISRLVLQDIEVLAVAQVAQDAAGVAAEPDSSEQVTTSGTVPEEIEEQPDAASVTLAVTPEQAAILVCAQERNSGGSEGSVWLTLRGFGEPEADPHTVYDVCNQPFAR